MKKQNSISRTAACLAAVVLALSGGSVKAGSDDKIIAGESVDVGSGTVSTWARVNGGGKVIWVGLTIPLSLVENPPPPGSGPAGAIAVVNYPAVVQQTNVSGCSPSDAIQTVTLALNKPEGCDRASHH